MSSVQSFLRQRNLSSSTLLGYNGGGFYELVATSGNVVGNYPPGVMMETSNVPTGTVLRDMGKTVKALVDGQTVPGYFRAVQVLAPGVTVASNGVNGLAPASNPAGNTGDKGYQTYYLPIVVDGRIAGGIPINEFLLSALSGQQ